MEKVSSYDIEQGFIALSSSQQYSHRILGYLKDACPLPFPPRSSSLHTLPILYLSSPTSVQ